MECRGALIDGDTKTGKSRVVPVEPSVLRILMAHIDEHVDEDEDAFVFATPDGGRFRLSNWRRRVWKPAIKKVGLPESATPYWLRHTAASLLAEQGVPVTTAAAILGHDPAVYLRTCAHLYPEHLDVASKAMSKARSGGLAARRTRRRPHHHVGKLRGSSSNKLDRTCRHPGLAGDFWSGCRDLNPGPLDPQSSALTKLRHSPSL